MAEKEGRRIMGKVDGGQLVVKALQREGVKYIFSLSGGHLLRIYDATIDAGIRIIANLRLPWGRFALRSGREAGQS